MVEALRLLVGQLHHLACTVGKALIHPNISDNPPPPAFGRGRIVGESSGIDPASSLVLLYSSWVPQEQTPRGCSRPAGQRAREAGEPLPSEVITIPRSTPTPRDGQRFCSEDGEPCCSSQRLRVLTR
jgi:hypothetical protein